MKDVVTRVKCMDMDGNIHEFSNEEMEFAYRHTKLSDSEYIVLEAEFMLNPANTEDIMEKIRDLNEKKTFSQLPTYHIPCKNNVDIATVNLSVSAKMRTQKLTI